MEKLYETMPYESKFTAKVEDILERGERLHVSLDRTAFYPGGGGQESDRGTLNGKSALGRVVNVYAKEGKVWHECEMSGAFSVGQEVEGLIDWERRYALMKSHTAEHILFHCLQDAFSDIEMVKVQISPGGSSILLKRGSELEMELVMKAEKRANELVGKSLPVTITEYAKDKVPEGVRAKLERIDSDIVRVVQIGDFDSCACAGIHVQNTSEIGILTISNIASEGVGQHKVSFLVGQDAQEYLLETKLACERACSVLQTTSDKLERTAGNLRAEKEKLEHAVKTLNERILDELKPAKLKDYNFYSKSLTGMDSKKILEKAGELIKKEKTIVLLGNKDADKGFLIIAKSPDTYIDIKEIANRVFAKMDGKGGGPDHFLSGAGESTKLGAAFGLAEEELTEKLLG